MAWASLNGNNLTLRNLTITDELNMVNGFSVNKIDCSIIESNSLSHDIIVDAHQLTLTGSLFSDVCITDKITERSMSNIIDMNDSNNVLIQTPNDIKIQANVIGLSNTIISQTVDNMPALILSEVTKVDNQMPSFLVQDVTSTNTFMVTHNNKADTYNGIVETGDSSVLIKGNTVNSSTLDIGVWTDIANGCGLKCTYNEVQLNAGNNNMLIDSVAGTTFTGPLIANGPTTINELNSDTTTITGQLTSSVATITGQLNASQTTITGPMNVNAPLYLNGRLSFGITAYGSTYTNPWIMVNSTCKTPSGAVNTSTNQYVISCSNCLGIIQVSQNEYTSTIVLDSGNSGTYTWTVSIYAATTAATPGFITYMII